MPLLDVAELAPIQLAWCNARKPPGRGMAAQGIDMLATVAFVASHREYPTADGLGPRVEPRVARWRPVLAESGNV